MRARLSVRWYVYCCAYMQRARAAKPRASSPHTSDCFNRTKSPHRRHLCSHSVLIFMLRALCSGCVCLHIINEKTNNARKITRTHIEHIHIDCTTICSRRLSDWSVIVHIFQHTQLHSLSYVHSNVSNASIRFRRLNGVDELYIVENHEKPC